jgi:hypothetical protein
MLERARAEVAVLAARREDITQQLGHLSGVIEALAVPTDRPSAPTAEDQHRTTPTGDTPAPPQENTDTP